MLLFHIVLIFFPLVNPPENCQHSHWFCLFVLAPCQVLEVDEAPWSALCRSPISLDQIGDGVSDRPEVWLIEAGIRWRWWKPMASDDILWPKWSKHRFFSRKRGRSSPIHRALLHVWWICSYFVRNFLKDWKTHIWLWTNFFLNNDVYPCPIKDYSLRVSFVERSIPSSSNSHAGHAGRWTLHPPVTILPQWLAHWHSPQFFCQCQGWSMAQEISPQKERNRMFLVEIRLYLTPSLYSSRFATTTARTGVLAPEFP